MERDKSLQFAITVYPFDSPEAGMAGSRSHKFESCDLRNPGMRIEPVGLFTVCQERTGDEGGK